MQNSASFACFAWSTIHTPVLQGQDVASCILNSLRSFYNSHTYTACADFDAHVRCVCLTAKHMRQEEKVVLDLSQYSPISDAYVLFYTFDNILKHVHVWGGLLYDELQEEMDFAYILQSRNCALTMRSVVELERRNDKDLDFAFPTICNNVHVSDTNLVTKLDWYMDVAAKAILTEETCVIRPSMANDAEVECISACLAIAYQILYLVPRDIMNSQFDGRILCNKFRRMILNAELYLLKHRLFEMHEDDLLQVLLNNGFVPEAGGGGAILDQSFVNNYPNANVLLPKRWLLVPFEQVPAHLELVLVKDGMCWLPVYWQAIYDWLSFQFQTQMQQHFLNARMYEGTRELDKYARHVVMFIMNDLPSASDRRQKGVNQKSTIPLDADTIRQHGKFVQDIEDMWNCMPPCMQQLKNNNRFPRNQERLYLIPTMYNGGFSLDSINRFLNALNDRWPKSPAETVQKRANPEALIKRDPGIHWCSNVIKHTKEKRENTPQCPFYSVAEGVIDADGCGKKCATHLGLRYPVKAPHNVIKYRLKFLVPTSEETRKAIVEQVKKEEASLSDEEEEESEEAKKSKRRKYIKIT